MKPLDYARPASLYECGGWTWAGIAVCLLVALVLIAVLALVLIIVLAVILIDIPAPILIFIPRTHAIVEALRVLLLP